MGSGAAGSGSAAGSGAIGSGSVGPGAVVGGFACFSLTIVSSCHSFFFEEACLRAYIVNQNCQVLPAVD